MTDLAPLKDLAVINYALNVKNTSALKNLKGLDSLEATNAAGLFHDVSGFQGLKKLDRLMVNENEKFTGLKGFKELTTIGHLVVQFRRTSKRQRDDSRT